MRDPLKLYSWNDPGKGDPCKAAWAQPARGLVSSQPQAEASIILDPVQKGEPADPHLQEIVN